MKCPKCQTDSPDDARFCDQCGASLGGACPACGAGINPGAKFCRACGHSLPEAAPEPSTSPPEPSTSPPEPSTSPPEPGTSPPEPSTSPPAPAPLTLEPISFVNGRYQVKKLLGEGDKKKVYLTRDTTLDREVAFALIKTEGLDDTARDRIKREAEAMGRLDDHPGIVTIYEYGEDDDQPYLVQPVMAGGNVEGLIEKAPDHRLPIEQAIDIAKSVCQALEFAHSKDMIHRDLRPGNVWIASDGVASLGGFGLAVASDVSRPAEEGKMAGTSDYMSPEEAAGGEVTAKANLYSLGAMLYEMVTGQPPFTGANLYPVMPSWHRDGILPGLEALILQLLEKNPRKRPASASDVLSALESVATDKVPDEGSDTKAASRWRPLIASASIVGVLLLVFLGLASNSRYVQVDATSQASVGGGGAIYMEAEAGSWVDFLEVTLLSNPATGFEWKLTDVTGDTRLEFVSREYFPPPSWMVGADGTEVWTFSVHLKGGATVSMEYGQPREGGTKAARTFELALTR